VVIGGGAWDEPFVTFSQAVEGVDAGGAPMLVVTGTTDAGGAPEFGVPASQGSGLFAAAFGASGQILWAHPLLTASITLQVDPAGALLALAHTEGTLTIGRWDAGGNVVGGASYLVDATKGTGLTWVSAPTAGGIVVAGEERVPQGNTYSVCVGRHFLLRIATAGLDVEPLPSRLP